MPGYLIKKRREELGLSQTEVARQLFLSQSAYSRIENKQTTLTVDTARNIARVLQCRLDELLPDDAILENATQHLHNPEELTAKIEAIVQKHTEDLKMWLADYLQQHLPLVSEEKR